MRVVRCCWRFLNPCAKNKYWRGAGVVEQAGLENRCTLWVPWVRIPPSPPKTREYQQLAHRRVRKPIADGL